MSITGTSASTQTVHRSYEPSRVRAEEYVSFHKQGFLLVWSLGPREDVQEQIDDMNNVLVGREIIQVVAVSSFRRSPQEKLQYWLRVLMLTHLPHVEPHFGTPCVANKPRTPVSRSCGGKPMSMMDDGTPMVARLRMPRRSTTMQTLTMGR